MTWLKYLFAGIAAALIIAIIAAFVVASQSSGHAEKAASPVPVLLYTVGFPEEFGSVYVGSADLSAKYLNHSAYGPKLSFEPLHDSISFVANINKSETPYELEYNFSSVNFSVRGEPVSARPSSFYFNYSLPMHAQYNAIAIKLAFLPLEIYGKNTSFYLVPATYFRQYMGNVSDVYISMQNASFIPLQNYSKFLRANLSLADNGSAMRIRISNNGSAPFNLRYVLISGPFLMQGNAAALPAANYSKPQESFLYLIDGISRLGINMTSNTTLSYIQTNGSRIGRLEDYVKSAPYMQDNISAMFNATLNVSRLAYLEQIMENSGYYYAMHALNDFDPYNYTVRVYASGLNAWFDSYHGILALYAAKNTTLQAPISESELEGQAFAIQPSGSRNFTIALGNLSGIGKLKALQGSYYSTLVFGSGGQYAIETNASA